MASLDSLQIRQALAKGVVHQVAHDNSVAIRLRYVGSGTVTSVTVDTATDLELISSDGGTETFPFASGVTLNTLGKVVDAVNASNYWEAKIIDGLRSQASASALVTGAISAGTDENGVLSWNLLADTTGTDKLVVVLSPARAWDAPKGHRVHLKEIAYLVDAGTAPADVRIVKRKGSVETQIFTAVSTDDTVSSLTFASGEGKISGDVDEELVVVIDDGGELTDTTDWLRVVGVVE